MVKEVVRFKLPLGSRTDEFVALLREVTAAMAELGVNPGVRWDPLSGVREVVIEREFASLAQYEADDAAFHGGKEFMAMWRRMEACAESMTVELWQSGLGPAELATRRAGGQAPK